MSRTLKIILLSAFGIITIPIACKLGFVSMAVTLIVVNSLLWACILIDYLDNPGRDKGL